MAAIAIAPPSPDRPAPKVAIAADDERESESNAHKHMHTRVESSINVHIYRHLFSQVGYTNAIKIASSLQGTIWKAQAMNDRQQSVCIKITDKALYNSSKALVGGKTYDVKEDVVTESRILKYITERKECPQSIVKFKAFMQNQTHYFFFMEHGGSSLFNFIKKAHHLLRQGQIDMVHWRKVVHIIFKQMVEAIEYIHSLNVVHMDISLENWLINDVNVDVVGTTGQVPKLTFLLDDIQVKLCDFGLAEKLSSGNSLSSKHCGKEPYKSPEIIDKKALFDAKANDVWSLAVCLFMLCVGGPPWNIAHKSDQNYLFVMRHSVFELLNGWKVINVVDLAWVHLFDNIFQSEKHRMNILEIKNYIESI